MKKRLLKFILALFVSISPILTITNVLAIDENYEPTVMPSREYDTLIHLLQIQILDQEHDQTYKLNIAL